MPATADRISSRFSSLDEGKGESKGEKQHRVRMPAPSKSEAAAASASKRRRAWFRLSFFIIFQFTATVILGIAVAGYNWIQIDNSIKTANTSVGLLRTAGLWQVCWAKPEDYWQGRGSTTEQLRDILNLDNHGFCTSDISGFYQSVWDVNHMANVLVTKIMATSAAGLALFILVVGISLGISHIKDLNTSDPDYGCLRSMGACLLCISFALEIGLALASVALWSYILASMAKKAKEKSPDRFLTHFSDYAGASMWLFVAGTVLVMPGACLLRF